MLKWWIPDIPRKLQDEIRRENYLTNEIIIKQEMIRARGIGAGGDSTVWNAVSGVDGKEMELLRPPSNRNSLRRRNFDGDSGEPGGRSTNEVMV